MYNYQPGSHQAALLIQKMHDTLIKGESRSLFADFVMRGSEQVNYTVQLWQEVEALLSSGGIKVNFFLVSKTALSVPTISITTFTL